jgi:hypothetical protein
MLTGESKWGFIVVDTPHGHSITDYAEITLECPRCGTEFQVDTLTDENMRYMGSGEWVPECPECGQLGTAE